MTDLLRLFHPRRAAAAPDYSLGLEWTPTTQQIDAARVRLTDRRAASPWRAVAASDEIDHVRIPILIATEAPSDGSDRTKRLRKVRDLAFDAATRFFVRRLIVSPAHYLIEFRHPKLLHHHTSIPMGLRFIALDSDAWRHGGQIGMMLDGSPLPFDKILGPAWAHTFHEANLVESYIQFVFDHTELDGEQIYVVSSKDDFIKPEGTAFAIDNPAHLIAQFCTDIELVQPNATSSVPLPNGVHATQQSAPPRPQANLLDVSFLIPPTCLRTVPSDGTTPEHAVIFATIIYLGQLHHVCLRVASDGKIDSLKQSSRTREGTALPVTPLRSFQDQKASIIRAIHDSQQAVAP